MGAALSARPTAVEQVWWLIRVCRERIVGFPLWPSTWSRSAPVLVVMFTRLFRVLTLCIRRFPVALLTEGP